MSDEYRELYRDDYCIVANHLPGEVSIRTGNPVDEARPTIVDAEKLRDALDEYLAEEENDG